MLKYIFWAGSIKGLDKELLVLATDYQSALVAVKKHVDNQTCIK